MMYLLDRIHQMDGKIMSHNCVPIYDIHSDVCYYKCVRLVASCCCVCSRLMNNCALATTCREKFDLYCATIWRRGPPRISTGISHTEFNPHLLQGLVTFSGWKRGAVSHFTPLWFLDNKGRGTFSTWFMFQSIYTYFRTSHFPVMCVVVG